jgi:hypothetical protein
MVQRHTWRARTAFEVLLTDSRLEGQPERLSSGIQLLRNRLLDNYYYLSRAKVEIYPHVQVLPDPAIIF